MESVAAYVWRDCLDSFGFEELMTLRLASYRHASFFARRTRWFSGLVVGL